MKRQNDIAVGNVVTSNIFNLLGIGGLISSMHPFEYGGIGMLDFGAMLVTSLLLLPLIRTGYHLERWEGGILLGVYSFYLWLLWPWCGCRLLNHRDAIRHDARVWPMCS